jgi:hypothetical protein
MVYWGDRVDREIGLTGIYVIGFCRIELVEPSVSQRPAELRAVQRGNHLSLLKDVDWISHASRIDLKDFDPEAASIECYENRLKGTREKILTFWRVKSRRVNACLSFQETCAPRLMVIVDKESFAVFGLRKYNRKICGSKAGT